MKDRCGATGLVCIKCNPGGCNNRLEAKKPAVFNYGDYKRALEEIERLKAENKQLREQNEQMHKEGRNVTGMIDYVKQKMCSTCTNEADCRARLESGEWYPCPLDLL